MREIKPDTHVCETVEFCTGSHRNRQWHMSVHGGQNILAVNLQNHGSHLDYCYNE